VILVSKRPIGNVKQAAERDGTRLMFIFQLSGKRGSLRSMQGKSLTTYVFSNLAQKETDLRLSEVVVVG
jgi:hypothetical protein